MKEFFWWCAGAHQETLQRYPQEHHKYVSIGATVFFTGLFAALAGGYALYFVFSGSRFSVVIALLFGGIWGLAIFNLDRYIVLSMDKSRPFVHQVLQALPRVVLAIIIGLVISRPLELKIFEKEIHDHLRNQYLVDQDRRVNALNNTFIHKYNNQYNQLAQLKTQVEQIQHSMEEGKRRLNHEIFGTKTAETSGVTGYGPFAKRKKAELHSQQLQLDSLRRLISRNEQELNTRRTQEGLLDLKIHSEESLDSVINQSGFADRNAALGSIHIASDGSASPSTAYAVIFITLLFIFFECLPVLVKLMSGRDPYEQGLHDQRTVHEYQSNVHVVIKKTVSDRTKEHRIQQEVQKIRNS